MNINTKAEYIRAINSAKATDVSAAIKTGSRILATAYRTLDAERLKANHGPGMRDTAWPAILLEMAEIAEQEPVDPRKAYSAKQVTFADVVCQAYSEISESAQSKKMALDAVLAWGKWKIVAEKYGVSVRDLKFTHRVLVVKLMSRLVG